MPSDSERLVAFIRTAKNGNLDDSFVVALLRQNGWSERRIFHAFSSYYEGVLGEPVPARGGRIEYAGDAFLYLLAFIALGCWTVAVGHLFYVLIDRWLPSGLDTTYFAQSLRYAVSFELATLIVAFPIFLVVARAIARQLTLRPETAESGVRKWLTYIALVIAAVVLIGDAIAFLNQLLQGDLTTRFVLKSLVLVVLAGGVFLYYLDSVRGDAVDPRRDRTFAGLAIAIVAVAVVAGFADIGSPGHARAVADDTRRVDDLRMIANAIYDDRPRGTPAASYVLPRSLTEITALPPARDPQTGAPYRYRVLHGTAYELCTTFETEDRSVSAHPFGHPAGPDCFTLDATKRV